MSLLIRNLHGTLMADDRSFNGEKLIRNLVAFIAKDVDVESGRMDLPNAKELLGTLSSMAGKGKDEIVQTVCREIGIATAAMIKEPLQQVLENRKLQITLELVPKSRKDEEKPEANMPSRRKSKSKKVKKP